MTRDIHKRVVQYVSKYYRKFQNPLSQRLLRGASWVFVGVVISRGLNLLAFFVVARILGIEAFGRLGIIQSTIGVFQVFAVCALGITATKYVAEYRISDPQKAGRVIGFAVVISLITGLSTAIILYCCAPWLANHLLADSHLVPQLRISCGVLLFVAVNGAQTGSLAGLESFRRLAAVNVFSGLASFPILLGGVTFYGMTGCIWGLAMSGAIGCIASQVALRVEMRKVGIPFTVHGSRQELPILIRFTIPALLGGATVVPVNWICYLMLVNGSNGYREMGILNAANQWYTAIVFIPNMLSQVLLPVLAERIGDDDIGTSVKLMSICVRVYTFVSIPIVLLTSVASPIIMRGYGRGYEHGWPTLIVVVCTAGIIAIQTPINQVLAATGRMWLGLSMNVGWGLICLALTHYMINLGSLGVSLARLLGYIIYALVTFGFAVNFVRYSRISVTDSNLAPLAPLANFVK